MRNERLAALVLATLALFAMPSPGAAQAPSRATRILALAGDSVGVLVGRDRVFTPDPSVRALSVCAAARCAPVRTAASCTVPQCPGTGALLTLDAPIADVSDLPTDRDGFNRAMNELRSDAALAGIAWSFGVHPDPTPSPSGPPRWIESGRTDRITWELGALGVGGVLGASGVGFAGGEVSGGFRYTWDAHDDDDDFLAIIFGDVLGADLRVRALSLFPGQDAASWAVTVGIAPAMGYATDHETFRLPTFYSVFLPEVGVALRDAFAPAVYAGWSLPVTLLLEEHLGLEARATVLIIDDWIPGDDTEVLVSFGLGLVGR